MNLLKKIWSWFDGRKTTIGAILLGLSTVITQLVIGVNHYDPAWLDTVILNLNYVGEAFVGGGLIHKLAKSSKTEE